MLILIPGTFLFDGLDLGPAAWLTLAWVLLLGLVATMPLGPSSGRCFAGASTPRMWSGDSKNVSQFQDRRK